jgi:aminoglycoside phosphotransferase (APT) family kinase protein
VTRQPDLAAVLDRLAPRFGVADEEPAPLDGGITNRNFVVRFGGARCVLRLVGVNTELLGISRSAERLAAEAASRLEIGPEVLDCGDGYLLTSFVESRPVDAAALRAEPGAVADALRAFHDSDLELPVRFDVGALLDAYAAVVLGRGGSLPEGWAEMVSLVARVVAALPAEPEVPCHDDLLGANLLVPAAAPETVLLVDWEYAGMGHRLFDLGNLSVNNEFAPEDDERLLAAYFAEPPSPARRAALALMRLVSDAREAAWGVVQATVSTLDFDFDGYAAKHLDRLRAAAAGRQVEEWLDAAAA